MATKITSRVIAPGAVTAEALAPGVGAGPVIANVQIANSSYVALDDTAVALEGGYILINGENFGQNVQVIIANTNATSVTYVSSSLVRAQVPAKSAGSYIMYLVNTDTGATAIRVNAVTYSGTPTWVTGSSLTEGAVDEAISIQLSANDATSYQLQDGSTLPTGLTLSANGLLSGTVTDLNEDTLYNFTIEAIDDENQDSPRAFSITITAGDAFINSTVLALKADSNTFITDTSTNSFTITPNGDTRPSAFSPYNTNWSNYFDGSTGFLTVPSNSVFSFGTGDFTVEAWVYVPLISNVFGKMVADSRPDNTNGSFWLMGFNSSGFMGFTTMSTGGVTLTATQAYPNQWTHYAATRQSGTVKLWVNGIGVASSNNNTDNISSSILKIGANAFRGQGGDAAATYLLGYISNLRIVKGTAVYTSNFTPSTSPLTAITNTSLLTCQSNRLVDNSINNFTITRNGDVKVTGFGPFTETDTTTGSGYFDGTGDYLSFGSNSAFSFSTGDFTIEGWIFTGDTSLTSGGYSRSICSIGNLSFYLRINQYHGGTTGALRVYDGSTHLADGSTTNLATNSWRHFALVRESGTAKLWIDGIYQTGGSYSTNLTNTTTNIIGAQTNPIEGNFNGYIANVRVIKGTAVYTSTSNFTPPTSPLTAISNTQLLTLQNRISYNNSQPIDESGVSNIITRNGNASAGSYTPLSPAGWSAYFDGTGDYLSVPQNSAFNFSTGAFTVEGWFYFWGSFGSVYNGLINLGNGASGGGPYTGWGLITGNTGTDIRWYRFDGTETQYIGNFSFQVGTWYHIAACRNSSSNLAVFVNGTRVISTTSSLSYNNVNSDPLNMGYRNDGVSGITYAKIYSSSIRIVAGSAVYDPTQTTLTVPTAPLTAIANTSLLTLRSNSFVDEGPNRFAITRNGDTRITPFSPFKTHTIVPDTHSVYFDGNGDYLTVADNAAFAVGSGNFTAEAWVYPTASPNQPIIMGQWDGVGGGTGLSWVLILSNNSSRNLRFIVSTDGSNALGDTISSSPLTLNAWNHVALVRNGNVFTIYLNGAAATGGSYTISAGASLFNATNVLSIGASSGGTQPFQGYISNARFVVGTAVYTTTFTPPTTPLTAITNTSLLTCQSPTIIDNSNNAFAITVNGNAQPTKYNPFGETITTGVEYSLTNHGGSYYFDGTGDNLSIPDSVDLEMLSSDFTIELWFNADQITASTQLLGKSWWTPFYFEGSNLVTYLSSDGVNWNIASNQVIITSPSPGVWYHVAMVRSGSSIKAYVNGVQTLSITSSASFYNGTDAMLIGLRGTTYYKGYISNIRIVKGTALYTSAFVPPTAPPTPVRGTTLLLNGAGAAITDGVGKNVLETVGNARVINGIKKYGTGAMYFDGTGDYLTTYEPVIFDVGSGNFTLEAWLYPTAYGGFFAKNQASDHRWMKVDVNGSGTITLYVTTSGSSWDTVTSSSSGVWVLNTWWHFALVRSGTSFKVYKNGTEIISATVSGSVYNVAGDPFILGATSLPGFLYQQLFTGYIDDLRITKGVARYTSNFTPPTSFKLK
jgi:hypothetical protein